MKFTKEKYVEKPILPAAPEPVVNLGANNTPEALTQRFIFPSDAASQYLSNLRRFAEEMVTEVSAAERADFESLTPKIVSKIIKNSYSGERLGGSLYEYAFGRDSCDPRSIRVSLYSAFNSKRLVEVGYRSTRLDPYGQQILKPRVYLGAIKELDENSVLLDTAYGIRRLFVKDLAWAAISPASKNSLSGVDLLVTGPREAPLFSVNVLEQDEIIKDEPREVFLGDESEIHRGGPVAGGLTKIQLNFSTVRHLIPYFGKKVYLELYNPREELWFSTFDELKTASWNSNRDQRIVLYDHRSDKIVGCTNGHMLIGVAEDLPENNL